jgi:GT2 family glycosyltransferase
MRRIGCFPDLMLMEDVELSLRLKSAGEAVYLGPGVTASGRRWQAGSFLDHTAFTAGWAISASARKASI